MYGANDIATRIMMSMYGNFPGEQSLRERELMGTGSLTGGGPRREQRLWGAEAAGRLGAAPPGEATDWNGERELWGSDAAGSIGGGGPMGRLPEGPMMSQMPGYSYKTRSDAPRYHMEMPYGGTPGVYAIRLDELSGPKKDPWQNMSPHDYIEYQRRSIGRRFRRPRR